MKSVGLFTQHPGHALHKLVSTKHVIIIDDASGPDAKSNIGRLAAARSFIAVPMLKENELVGAISIYRQEVRPFTAKQTELVTNFAAQAVIAIENTRLLNELRQRTDELVQSVSELQALGELTQAVNSTIDIETVLATIVAKTTALSNTEAGAIYVYDEGTREFRLRTTYGLDDSVVAQIKDRHVHLGRDRRGGQPANADSDF